MGIKATTRKKLLPRARTKEDGSADIEHDNASGSKGGSQVGSQAGSQAGSQMGSRADSQAQKESAQQASSRNVIADLRKEPGFREFARSDKGITAFIYLLRYWWATRGWDEKDQKEVHGIWPIIKTPKDGNIHLHLGIRDEYLEHAVGDDQEQLRYLEFMLQIALKPIHDHAKRGDTMRYRFRAFHRMAIFALDDVDRMHDRPSFDYKLPMEASMPSFDVVMTGAEVLDCYSVDGYSSEPPSPLGESPKSITIDVTDAEAIFSKPPEGLSEFLNSFRGRAVLRFFAYAWYKLWYEFTIFDGCQYSLSGNRSG